MSLEDKYFVQNPKIDYLFGYHGNLPVQTKQDKFKPIRAVQINEDGSENIVNDLYVKNPDKNSLAVFQKEIRRIALEQFPEGKKILKPKLVEVYLSITMKESRFKVVDVDNLAKSVLDCLNGIVYDDDSQVSSLAVRKEIHPMKTDGILIGITELTRSRESLLGDIFLFKEGKEW